MFQMVQFIRNRFKGSEMTHKNEETVVDAQMHHPFRCLVADPLSLARVHLCTIYSCGKMTS